jgi:3-oxoacyl-[acyl-carrier protein] reductase
MDLGLRDRVALVVAGSKGLGRAVAMELAAEGARVAICARGKDALDDTVEEITAAGGRATGFVTDVNDTAALATLVTDVENAYGPIDVLVTNSGGPRSGQFSSLTAADWEEATRILLTSAVTLTGAVLPGMRQRRWGRILMVTSIAAKQPVDGLMLSNSLRAAVTGFARTLATEVASDGVTVNTLMPGYTRTQRVVDLAEQMAAAGDTTPDAIYAKWEAQIPMGRLGEPAEFGALAAFLASDRASYITGQSIAVDGGWIRGLF